MRKILLMSVCLLGLISTATADTFAVTGQWNDFSGQINPFLGGGFPIDMTKFPLPMHLDGTLAFTGGVLTSLNVAVTPEGTAFGMFSPGTQYTFTDDQHWTVAMHYFHPSSTDVYQVDLTLTDTAGMLAASLFEVAQPGTHAFDSFIGNFTNFAGTVVQTPLPGALLLFASGLGALGLLRRSPRK